MRIFKIFKIFKKFKDDKKEQKRIEQILSSNKSQKYSHVAVGILQDSQLKNQQGGFSMVDLAMVHEYGSHKQNIPARSFIRATCDAKRKNHIKLLKKLERKVFLSQLSQKQALAQFGEMVAKEMVQTINDGIDPELKPKTIRHKKSSKALIDTGRLKGAITHEVRT